jgi:REP element-mobilizing transposase RayT
VAFDRHKHSRRSVRVQGYDVHQRECLFGEVVDGEMQLNEYGKIARNEWVHTASIRRNVVLDAFIVMPNHLHGIIILTGNVGATRRVAPIGRVACMEGEAPPRPYDRNGKMRSGSIGAIIGQFKSIATKRINKRHGAPGVPVWQRNYYECIIWGEAQLDAIRRYIADNPGQWDLDRENPRNL